MPNFIEIKESFCGRTYVRKDRWKFETGFIRSTLSTGRPKKLKPGLVASYDIWPGNE